VAGFFNDTYMGVPGIGTAIETIEREFTWGREEWKDRRGVQISGAARDSTNTPTTFLRRGLLLGQITASPGLWKEYNPASTDGSQIAVAVLSTDLDATDLGGTNTARLAWALFGGGVKAAQVVGLDAVARAQMGGRFLFDDDQRDQLNRFMPHLVEVAKTTNYTVTAADAGTLFTTTGASGAVTFTLPTLAAGLGPFYFHNTVGQNMSIASAGSLDDILTFNDLTADSITFSTAGNLIGASAMVWANQAGTKWYVRTFGSHTVTVA
jgi:hypothetical protein